MDEYQAEQLACEVAAKHKPSYYTEPFRPHDWVIAAVLEAYERGVNSKVSYNKGYDEGWDVGYDQGYEEGYNTCECDE